MSIMGQRPSARTRSSPLAGSRSACTGPLSARDGSERPFPGIERLLSSETTNEAL